MDADRFDAIARGLGARATRRLTLGGLLGAGLAATAATTVAGTDRRDKKQKRRRAKASRPQAAPDCANPGPSRNLNGCDFSARDFSGRNLSGSALNAATFRNAELDDADLSDTGMRRTDFRGANLCSADLSSSALNNADFRGSDGPDGRPTNLTRANLRSSSCAGLKFDANTIFCGTRLCNGKVRNDGCPAGVDPDDVCCADADCGPARVCRNGECLLDPGTCAAGQNLCRDGTAPCGDFPGCQCVTTTSSATFCGLGSQTCSNCSSDDDCTAVTGPGSVCADYTGDFCSCRDTHRRACVAPCGQCSHDAQCGAGGVCCDGICRLDCCTTADCGPNETCEKGVCVCPGCRSRINNRCAVGDAWVQCGADGARCAECHRDQVCAAGSQTCASCDFGGVGGTWCDVRDDFAAFQCGRNCACAKDPRGFGVCFNTAVVGYCSRGGEPICEYPADCVIEGLGTDCIVMGGCETCTTACVTRCGSGEGSGEGPLQLVVLD